MTTSKLNFASTLFLSLVICCSLPAQNQYDQYSDYNTYDDYNSNSGGYDQYNSNSYDTNSGYNSSSSSYYDQNHPLVGVSDKVVSNMQQLKNTRFMKEYVAMQIEIEETITMVKSNQQLYSPEDISQIKIAYRTTATEFNRVLNELKKGLLQGKYKAKNSVYTHQNLERKLQVLTRFYEINFKNPIAEIVQGGEGIADVEQQY